MATTLVPEGHLAADHGRRVATDPDGVADPLDVDPAGAAQDRPLRGDVRRGQHGTGQPLRDAGVEAAGHRVLGDPVPGTEGPHLTSRVAAGARPDDPDVEPVSHAAVVEVFQANNEKLKDLLFEIIPALPLSPDRPALSALTGARFDVH